MLNEVQIFELQITFELKFVILTWTCNILFQLVLSRPPGSLSG